MTSKIEQVAAIFAAELMELTAVQRETYQFPRDCNGDTWDRAMCAARAAIEAMREPTEGMIQEGAWATGADNVWRAMIDAALSERNIVPSTSLPPNP